MPRWSEHESFKFVSLYRHTECLWNVFHPSYKNRQKRTEAFGQMASEMSIAGFTADDVPKKIRNFRSTYCQELAKIEKSTESENLYTPSVKWFHDMDYVMRNSNNAERPVMANTDAIEPNVNYCFVTTENDDFVLENPATYENLLPATPYVSTSQQSRPKKRPRLQNILASSEDPPESEKSMMSAEVSSEVNLPVEEDECDIIGKLVAMQLRKLDPDDIVDANLEIQHVLAKYRKKQTQSVSVDSSMPQKKEDYE